MIGCLVLCDEMVYVLDRDPRIENVFIIDNPEGRTLMEKLSSTPSENALGW